MKKAEGGVSRERGSPTRGRLLVKGRERGEQSRDRNVR
jgi:hypothetical protein